MSRPRPAALRADHGAAGGAPRARSTPPLRADLVTFVRPAISVAEPMFRSMISARQAGRAQVGPGPLATAGGLGSGERVGVDGLVVGEQSVRLGRRAQRGRHTWGAGSRAEEGVRRPGVHPQRMRTGPALVGGTVRQVVVIRHLDGRAEGLASAALVWPLSHAWSPRTGRGERLWPGHRPWHRCGWCRPRRHRSALVHQACPRWGHSRNPVAAAQLSLGDDPSVTVHPGPQHPQPGERIMPPPLGIRSTPSVSHGSVRIDCRPRAMVDFPELDAPFRTITWTGMT